MGFPIWFAGAYPDPSRMGRLKLLALDLGELRIGLAVSNQKGTLVLPAGHLVRSKLGQDIERVLELVQERDAQGIVVGVPYNQSGDAGSQAKRARRFINALKRHTTLPVHAVDERFTSFEAEAMLREAGRQPSRDRGAVDEAAAALILQRFLDQQKS